MQTTCASPDRRPAPHTLRVGVDVQAAATHALAAGVQPSLRITLLAGDECKEHDLQKEILGSAVIPLAALLSAEGVLDRALRTRLGEAVTPSHRAEEAEADSDGNPHLLNVRALFASSTADAHRAQQDPEKVNPRQRDGNAVMRAISETLLPDRLGASDWPVASHGAARGLTNPPRQRGAPMVGGRLIFTVARARGLPSPATGGDASVKQGAAGALRVLIEEESGGDVPQRCVSQPGRPCEGAQLV